MRINHNIASMVTQGALSQVNRGLNTSLERLSTGMRINRASDDAAGLSVSENLRTQVRGIQQARANASDGVSLLQIAEGAANEISSLLQRMRELAVQSTNDTLTTTERSYTNQEYVALISEIDRIVDSAQYNGITLLDGKAGSFGTSGAQSLHIGANAATADAVTITISGISAAGLGGLSTNQGITSQALALNAITSLDTAVNSINSMRSDLGAYVNRLEHAINNLDNQAHNTQAAESVIRDVDFAAETSVFTRNQIMVQSATSMLAQSNMVPQTVLSLLG